MEERGRERDQQDLSCRGCRQRSCGLRSLLVHIALEIFNYRCHLAQELARTNHLCAGIPIITLSPILIMITSTATTVIIIIIIVIIIMIIIIKMIKMVLGRDDNDWLPVSLQCRRANFGIAIGIGIAFGRASPRQAGTIMSRALFHIAHCTVHL